MKISFILLLMLGVTLADVTTLDPRFQLSFDGFVVFLKELAALRIRHQKVKDTGRTLSNRIDYLAAAILKTNMTIRTPLEKMLSIADNTRNLDVRMKDVKNTVKKTRQKMARLQNSTSHATQGRIDLAKLADGTNTTLTVLRDVIDNLSPSVGEFQNSSFDLKYEKDKLKDQIEGMSETTEYFEMVRCDSGFDYDNSGSSSNSRTSTVRYSPPFNSTPSVLYSLTRLHTGIINADRGYPYNRHYYMSLHVASSGVTNSEMSLNVQKNSDTPLKELEYNWMACYM